MKIFKLPDLGEGLQDAEIGSRRAYVFRNASDSCRK
jgi:hypothetical protein